MMAHDHFQAGDGSGSAVADSIIAEAQERLRQHRQQADGIVLAQHRRLEAQVQRRSLIGAICVAAMITPAVVGVRWLGLPLGALIGVLLLHGPLQHLRLTWIATIITSAACLSGLPFIQLRSDTWLLTSLGIVFGLLALASLPLTVRWIVAPIVDAEGPQPSGDIGLVRRFAPPEELMTRGAAQQAISTVNWAIAELKHRSSLIPVVVIGMALVWLLHPLCNLAQGQGGLLGGIGAAPEAARMQSLLALAGGLAAAWIARSEMPVPLGMLVYGLGIAGTQMAAVICGLSSFTVWTSIWVWGAWIITGGVLALLTEHRDLATPKRVT